MQDYASNLSHNIYANRKRLGMTQEELAQKVGVTYQSVSKWELGVSCPDISLLPVLAEIFNISIDDLIGLESSSQNGEKKDSNPTDSVKEEDGTSSVTEDFKDSIRKQAQGLAQSIRDAVKRELSHVEVCLEPSSEGEKEDPAEMEEIDLNSLLPDDDTTMTFVIFKGEKAVHSKNMKNRVRIVLNNPIANLNATSSLSFDNVNVQGGINVSGNVSCDDLTVGGAMNCLGSISCDDLETSSLVVGENVNCEDIHAEKIECHGSISAESIEAEILYKK